MSNLRKLHGYSVKDTERKPTIMQFSPYPLPHHETSSLNQAADQRSRAQRLALVGRLTKRHSLQTDTEDIVLNFDVTNHRGQSEAPLSQSVQKEAKEPNEGESNDCTEKRGSAPKQDTDTSVAEYEKDRHVPGKLKDPHTQNRHPAKGHFTPNPDQSQCPNSTILNIHPPSPRRPCVNLSDPSNPILHPPRLTYSSFNKTESCSCLLQPEEKKKKGSYRKPLAKFINLVDKHLAGEISQHQNKNFLSQAVHILSMMENELSSQEVEVITLKREAHTLTFQMTAREEEHKTELRCISAQLEEARTSEAKLNEQLRSVLEENMAVQKELIKLEWQYLKSMMRIAQIKEAHTEVEEIKREIEELRGKWQEPEKAKELKGTL